MNKFFNWILESNRPKHVVVVFLVGLFFGLDGAFIASFTAEMKDWMWNGSKDGYFGWLKGNGFDWLDFVASMLGGAVGAALNMLILKFWFNL